MDWSQERWVKLYVRETVSWDNLDWQARAVFLFALKRADRCGEIDAGGFGIDGLANSFRMPRDTVTHAVTALVTAGSVTWDGQILTIVNYSSAQQSRTSGAERMRKYREKSKSVTKCDTVTSRVTSGDDKKRIEESRKEENRSEATFDFREGVQGERAPASPEPPPVRAPAEQARLSLVGDRPKAERRATSCPRTDVTPEALAAWLAENKIPENHLELSAFLDYHRAKGTLFKDWGAGWRTWVRNSKRWSRNSGSNIPLQQPAKEGEFKWKMG